MLSEKQKSEFWDIGVIVVESALAAAQLKPLQDELEAWIETSRQHDAAFGEMSDGRPRFDVEPGHSSQQPALRRIAAPEEISDNFLSLLHRGPLVEAVVDLIGVNLRFDHAKLNSKLPGSATTVKWHQDFTFDPHSNDNCVTAMLFLDDVTSENGAPRVVPGSHLGPLHSLWQGGIFTGAVADIISRACEDRAIECTGPAGSLCLMHTRSLHGSAENMTDQARNLFIANLTAADAVRLSPNALPSIYSGKIIHGEDPGRIRSIDFTVETPEIPEGASFFSQQEKS